MTGQPWLSGHPLAVLGTGSALPGAPVSTDALVNRIADRFGFSRSREAHAVARRMRIETRYVCRPFEAADEAASPGCSNVDLAAGAVAAALADAGVAAREVGYLIGHTATPLQPLPSNVAHVADVLGYDGPHLELRQACTGFANALMIATGLIAGGCRAPIVIVGSETGSLFFDPRRATSDDGQLVNMVQMGDAAAAIVVGHATEGQAMMNAAWYGSLGHGRPPGLSMRHGRTDFDHDFAGILASGAALMDANRAAATDLGFDIVDADIIVPHQVSGRVATQVARHYACPEKQVFANGGRVGNTGSAAIWLALAQLRAAGLEQGATIAVVGAEATKYMYGGFHYVHG